MAATPEAKVKKAVRQVLDGLGAYYVMPVTGGFGKQGAPDFLVCIKGRFYGIECKAGKNTVTALQEAELKKIEDARGHAFIVNEVTIDVLRGALEAMEWIEEHNERTYD